MNKLLLLLLLFALPGLASAQLGNAPNMTEVVAADADLLYIYDTSGSAVRVIQYDSLYHQLGRQFTTSNTETGITVTYRVADGTIDYVTDVTLTGTETLTNKTINTASNTITVVEADISDLGSYLLNIVEDTTPQLGADLETGGFDINGFSTGKGLFDVLGNEIFIFDVAVGAVNYLLIQSASTGTPVALQSLGDDTNVGLNLTTKGSGIIQHNGVEAVTISGTQTLTGKSIVATQIDSGTIPAARVGADHINAITEIATALKGGADLVLMTGTTGASGNCVEWNADGDLVDSGAACGGGSGAFSDAADPIVQNTTTKDVSIGPTHNNAAKLSIDGDADQVQLTVQQAPTQTDAPVIIETSAGTEIMTVEPGGLITTAVGLDGIGAIALTIGSPDITSITLTTDGTGTGEVILPAQSVNGGEIVNDGVGPTQIDETAAYAWSNTHTYADGSFLDLSAILHDDTSPQGFRLPNVGVTPSNPTGDGGYLSYEATNKLFLLYDGNEWHMPDASGLMDFFRINEAAGISRGELVYFSGATGANPEVSLATNDDPLKSNVFGIAEQSGADNATILVRWSGHIEDQNTAAFAEGADLLLGTGGAYTDIHPTGLNDPVPIGRVSRSHATLGVIQLNINNGFVHNSTFNGSSRQILRNSSTGTSALAAYTSINDAEHYMSIGIVGTGHSSFIPETAVMFSEGYGPMQFINSGNHPFIWNADTTDAHTFVAKEFMKLTADGRLGIRHTVDPDSIPNAQFAVYAELDTMVIFQGGVTAGDSTAYFLNDGSLVVTGFGSPSLTDGGILIGGGDTPIAALGVATNGQIPIGDGATDPVLATITGTANEVAVINGAGTITLSTPNQVRSMWWGAGALSSDGTNCADPTEVTIGSWGKKFTTICTDNDGSIMTGTTTMPDGWDGGVVTFEFVYIQDAADTGVLNADVSGRCTGATETPAAYGTEVAIDDAAVTGTDAVDATTSGNVTLAGTCSAGDMVQFQIAVDATGTTTAMATMNFVGVKMEYTISTHSDN